MKKLDKLILGTFIRKFLGTFIVILFIFLIQYIVTKKLKDLLGKDLGIDILGEFILYFCIILIPSALPISILFTSLITFGTLGEHNELVAMKSAGVSLLKIIGKVFFFVCLLVMLQIMIHDKLVTWASLKGYTLLYNIKITKPTLDFEEDIFYNGIPGYSIKISEKDKETEILSQVVIYDHTQNNGNTSVIMAEKGRMFLDEESWVLNMYLFDGRVFKQDKKSDSKETFWKQSFDSAFFKFSLVSFGMADTDERLFTGHNLMKEITAIKNETDSLDSMNINYFESYKKVFFDQLHVFEDSQRLQILDSTRLVHEATLRKPLTSINMLLDSGITDVNTYHKAISRVENLKKIIIQYVYRYQDANKRVLKGYVDINRRLALAFSIFALFIIAGPIALMIKKGGLGIPALISVILYALHYILTIYGNKLSTHGGVSPQYGPWLANAVFLCIGIFLLQRASVDARLFEFNLKNLFTFSKQKKNE